MAAHAASGTGALVDVVAEVEHQVQVLLSHMPPCRVEAALPVLAGGEGQAHPAQRPGRVGGGPGPADPAEVPPRAETVPVGPGPLPPVDLDVHAMGEAGMGEG